MNEINESEKLLLSWTPRRPSKGLEQRLFAGGEVAARARAFLSASGPAEELPSFRLGWLAPAAVAGLMLCVLLNQRCGAGLAGSSSGAPMMAMILSNQSAAAYLTATAQSEQNNLPADAFKWNGGGVTARLTVFAPGRRED